jgi:hypothetical protein
MLVMPDDFAAAAEELRALLAADSPTQVDDFIDLVERLPIASKTEAGKRSARTKALADVGLPRFIITLLLSG